MVCCPLNSLAQKTTARDSLTRIIKNPVTTDTTRVLAEVSLGEYYRFINADSANIIIDQAIAHAKEKSFYKGEGFAYNIKGLLNKDQRSIEPAIENFKTAIRLIGKSDSLAIAGIYNNIGLAWADASNHVESEKNYSIALKIYERRNDLKGLSNTYSNFGQINRSKGLFFTSLDYYFKALAILEANNISEELLGNTYGNLANVYKQLEKFNEAIIFQKKAIAIFEKLGLTLKVKVSTTNLANALVESNQLDEAEKYATETIEYFKENKRPRITLANQTILMLVAQKKGELDKAFAIAEEAYELATSLKYPEAEATILTNMAEIQFYKKNYAKAKGYADKSVALTKENDLLESEKDAMEQLSQILVAMGNYKEGHAAFVRYTALKDSTFNKGKLSRLFELEKKYEVDKKQSEVDLLESKNKVAAVELASEKRSRLQLIVVTALLLVLAVVIYVAYRTKARLNVKLAEQNELIDSINKDLQARALRAQMNPHFIFNSLSSIQYLIIKNKTESAFDYLSQFSTLLRLVMDNSEKNWITLTEEKKVLELYLELEKLRFNNSFSYSIENGPHLDNAKMLPLLIQPYVENAIIHGLLPKEGDRSLKITFSGNEKTVLCVVEDNGIGRAAAGKIAREKNKVFASKGMNYSEGRMKVLNAMIGGESKIEIIDLTHNGTPAGTQVRITINQP